MKQNIKALRIEFDQSEYDQLMVLAKEKARMPLTTWARIQLLTKSKELSEC